MPSSLLVFLYAPGFRTILTGKLEWTALYGTEKRNFRKISQIKCYIAFMKIPHDMVVKFWREFYVLYTKPQNGEDSYHFKHAKEFIELFIQTGRKNREGYEGKINSLHALSNTLRTCFCAKIRLLEQVFRSGSRKN